MGFELFWGEIWGLVQLFLVSCDLEWHNVVVIVKLRRRVNDKILQIHEGILGSAFRIPEKLASDGCLTGTLATIPTNYSDFSRFSKKNPLKKLLFFNFDFFKKNLTFV